MTNYKNPYPTVDIIIEYKGGIVLIKRKNPPYGWAIPGGFVDHNESLPDAAIREAKEETSLEVELLLQFYTYSRPERDPRFHTISTVYIARGSGELKGADDASIAEVFTEETLPEDIVFDHREILNDFFTYKKTGIRPGIK